MNINSKDNKTIIQGIQKLAIFRNNLGSQLSVSKIKQIWGNKGYKVFISWLKSEGSGQKISSMILRENIQRSAVQGEKIKIAKEYLSKFIISDWVKYIAISGSVAAGTVKKEDDIDLFIVVKDHRMWIYRGLVLLKLVRSKKYRLIGLGQEKDLFCLNFIVEERGLKFEAEDIFTLNELFYMIPIYNNEYFNKLLIRNSWLEDKFGVSIKKSRLTKWSTGSGGMGARSLYNGVNWMAYLSQIAYMIVKRHSPDLGRIGYHNKQGHIAFYPRGFRQEKEKLMEDALNKDN